MPSEVQICNKALARISHSVRVTAIDPPDGTREAAYCAEFYPGARDFLLDVGDWPFATKHKALALNGDGPGGWTYEYALPSEAMSPKQLYNVDDDWRTKPEGDPYITQLNSSGDEVILTDTEDAVLRYSVFVTDPNKFPPTFVEALAWLLASDLAGVIPQDAKLASYCLGMALRLAGTSATISANSTKAQSKAAIERRYPIGKRRRPYLLGVSDDDG